MSNEHDIYRLIKYVAIYLRKSRGDELTVLDKHKTVLIDLCKKYGWKYVLYEEIESGDSIAIRPQMLKLLDDVKSSTYDAVVVVDIDRLSRGDGGDQDTIKKAIQKNGTFIVTPHNIYNPNNDDDEFRIDIESLFARQEYKKIKKRLQQGKKVGARRGDWVNGTPPYPYQYQSWGNDYNEKGLVVNQDKLKVYRMIIEMALKSKPSSEIAYHLNKLGIQSPRGLKWAPITIHRLLQDETHLGKILSNKGSGDSHAKKKLHSKDYARHPKEEWIIVENCHESVKSLEEHTTILALIKKRKVIPVRSRKGEYIFSGLVKCGLCGNSLQFITRKNGTVSVKRCQHADFYGNMCINRGGNTSYIISAIEEKLLEIQDKILRAISSSPDSEIENLKIQIDNWNKELKKKQTSIERIQEAYESGDYELEIYRKRKDKVKKEVEEYKKELDLLDKQLSNIKKVSSEDKLIAIREFSNKINENCSTEELNRLYKTILDSIIWTRSGDSIEIEINFL